MTSEGTSATDDVVAVIPARGGSKGVPKKNLQRVGGTPLVARAVNAVTAVLPTSGVFVSTDDDEIASVAAARGAQIIRRPDELASDVASSEVALLHACDEITRRRQGRPPRALVFVQATSPFIETDALRSAIARVVRGESDVVVSAIETHEFLWKIDSEGHAGGVNHDHRFRPRRQDREPHFRETGAFYVMDWNGFINCGFRFFGRIGLELTDPSLALEIDNEADLELARVIGASMPPAEARPILRTVDTLIMDFDGVHTDDRVVVSQDGVENVIVSRSDGLGLGMLSSAGVRMLILSRERNRVVKARGDKLGIEVLQGVDDKAEALGSWCRKHQRDLAHTAYVGNDVNDLPAMRMVGIPIAVSDADPRVIRAAQFVLSRPGGRGALREMAELLLTVQQEWNGESK